MDRASDFGSDGWGFESLRARSSTWIVLALAVLLAAPTLVFGYLPMTDLPQHEAVASILRNLHDPAFGFDVFYERRLAASPYLLPYGIELALAAVVPLDLAMRVAAFLSVLAIPAGFVVLASGMRKPASLALLVFPLAFNRAFFWGFVNFNLSVGLALAAIGCLAAEPQTRGRRLAAAALAILTVFTHVYGLALILGYVALHAALGGGLRSLRPRAVVLAPALALAAGWALAGDAVEGYGGWLSPPFAERVAGIPSSILGGYKDGSEAVVLVVFAATLLASCAGRRPPWSREAPVPERVFAVMAAGNVVLYFLLPQATFTAKFVHFRHALLAAMMLPPVVFPASSLRRLARPLVVACALVPLVNSWAHLWMFDREASGFDAVLDRLPERPRVAELAFDVDGDVMATAPYLHFAAYAQARKGGLVAVSFPRLFWNLPVAMRDDAGVPPTPTDLEWYPTIFDARKFGGFYDHVVVRTDRKVLLGRGLDFPYEPVLVDPPWQLYRRVDEPGP